MFNILHTSVRFLGLFAFAATMALAQTSGSSAIVAKFTPGTSVRYELDALVHVESEHALCPVDGAERLFVHAKGSDEAGFHQPERRRGGQREGVVPGSRDDDPGMCEHEQAAYDQCGERIPGKGNSV